MRGTMLLGHLGTSMFPFMFMSIIGIALIIIAIVLLVKSKNTKANINDNSLNVLKEVYAKGEIDEDEFYKRATVLSGSPYIETKK
ncbi:MAG TPA: hypothetical protein VJ916_03030 [Anaerovoracaceae bacterium]|nr:hypothetical protein [Anaerovoracaceae bacterium]